MLAAERIAINYPGPLCFERGVRGGEESEGRRELTHRRMTVIEGGGVL